jgi:hypothetical protein
MVQPEDTGKMFQKHLCDCLIKQQYPEFEHKDKLDTTDSLKITIAMARAFPKQLVRKDALKQLKDILSKLNDVMNWTLVPVTFGNYQNEEGENETEPSMKIESSFTYPHILEEWERILSTINYFCRMFCETFFQESIHIDISGNCSGIIDGGASRGKRFHEVRKNPNWGYFTQTDIEEIFAKPPEVDINLIELRQAFLRFNPKITTDGNNNNLLDEFDYPRLREGSKIITIDEILSSKGPTMINGVGGVGKTTIAKIIAAESIIKEGFLPIMVTGKDIQIRNWREIKEILSTSFKNLTFQSNMARMEKSYIALQSEFEEIILLVDQLDDVDAEDYIDDIKKFKQTVQDLFECKKIALYVFVRRDNKIAQYRKLKISTELNEIQKALLKLGVQSDNMDTELKAINEFLKSGSHELVLADVAHLEQFFSERITLKFPERYPIEKALHIPRLIKQETNLPTKFCKAVLQSAIAQLFWKEKAINDSDLLEPLKINFAEMATKQNINRIIVHSRMFIEKQGVWELNTHDILRDHFASSFYSNRGTKKIVDFFLKNDLNHPLSKWDDSGNRLLTTRIIENIASDYEGNKLQLLINLMSNVFDSKDCEFAQKKDAYEILFGQSNAYRKKLGLIDYDKNGVSNCIKDDDLYDIGISTWNYFGYQNLDLKDDDSRKEFLSIMKPYLRKEILTDSLDKETFGFKGPVKELMRKLTITVEQWERVFHPERFDGDSDVELKDYF